MAFTIEHHELLGIQAIHDYVGCRIWRSSRGELGTGVEAAEAGQRDGRGVGVVAALRGAPRFAAAPVERRRRPQRCRCGDDPNRSPAPDAALPLPTLREHDQGLLVAHLQQVLSFWQFYRAKVDLDPRISDQGGRRGLTSERSSA